MNENQTPPTEFTDEEILAAEAELESAGVLPQRERFETSEPEFTDEELLAADEEMQSFGSDPGQVALAAAEASARGATLGLSDVAAKEAGAPMHEVYAREVMNPVVSTVADIGTTVSLGLMSGGTSLLARGGVAIGKKAAAKAIAANALKTAGAPIRAVEITAKAAGKLADKAISKGALKQILKDTGRGKFVKELVQKSIQDGATLATEGALYSAGRALSNEALGKEDLTAESFMAHVGTGALLGAATGGLLGAGKTTAPVFKKLGTTLGSKVSRSFNKLASPEEAAVNLIGDIPSKVVKQERYMPDYKTRVVDYLQKLGTTRAADNDMLASASEKYLNSVGTRLRQVSSELESATTVNKLILPRANQFYKPIVDDLERIMAENDVLGKASREATAPIRKLLETYKNKALKNERITFQAIERERKFLGKMIGRLKKSPDPTLALEGFSSAYGKYRQQVDGIVDAVGQSSKNISTKQLLSEYKQLNKDFEIGSIVNPKLKLKAERGERASVGDLLTMLVSFDLLGAGGAAIGLGKLAMKRNTLQNLAVKGDLARANQNIQKRILEAIPVLASSAKLGARAAKTTALYSLAQSGFSTKQDQKTGKIRQAENEKEAFANIRDNLSEYVTNQDMLMDRMTKGLFKLNAHAPEVGAFAAQTATRAIQFLYDKMPKDPSNAFVQPFARKFEPSTLEIAKFQRYVQIVENPMSILDEAEAGTLTQEHVDAFKSVYPTLYTEVRTKLFNELIEQGDELDMSYNKKVLLGNLLSMPLDQSLSGAFIMDLQKPFIAAQDQSQPAQGAGKPINTSKMTIADRASTDTQSFERRRQS